MIDDIQSTRLPNGIVVLTEHMPGLRSVTAGIWIRRGSRHESPELNGICHFIEHAVFKGTQRRTAHDIAVESDRLGGHLVLDGDDRRRQQEKEEAVAAAQRADDGGLLVADGQRGPDRLDRDLRELDGRSRGPRHRSRTRPTSC